MDDMDYTPQASPAPHYPPPMACNHPQPQPIMPNDSYYPQHPPPPPHQYYQYQSDVPSTAYPPPPPPQQQQYYTPTSSFTYQPPPPQQQQLHQLHPPPKFTALQKVQHWNMGGTAPHDNRDSGVQSMSQSSAASMMSSIHAASQISAVSSMHGSDYGHEQQQQLNEQQIARFQNIPSSFRQGDRENASRALSELLPLLTDTEEEVVLRALEIIQKIAKFDDSNYSDPLIRDRSVIDALLQALKAHRSNKKIVRLSLCTLFHISSSRRHGLDLIVQTIQERGAACLEDLLHCISVKEHACFKYTFLLLHNLMSEPRIAKQVIQQARELKILTQIVGWLGEKNEKLLAIIVDIVHLLLVDRKSDQKSLFLSLDGPKKLVAILEGAQYENLLSRATKLLKYISHYDPKRVVEAGALEVLHLHLHHSSQRLLRDVLTCVRDLSDVPTKDRDVTLLLGKVLQLLGSNDLGIQQLCAQILANLSANNKRNKEFLAMSNATASVFQLLYEIEAHLQMLRSQPQQPKGGHINGQLLEDIQDNALTILRSLCVGHEMAAQVQLEVMAPKGAQDILLEKLIQKRIVLVRKTLRILCLTATQDVNLARFKDGATYSNCCPYIHEIVSILHIAACQLPHSPTVEGVSVSELIQCCLSVLQLLCRDQHLLINILEALKAQPMELQQQDGHQFTTLLPQWALAYEELAPKGIPLIAELGAYLFNQDHNTLRLLNSWANSSHTQIAPIASRSLSLIEQGGDSMVNTTSLTNPYSNEHAYYYPSSTTYNNSNNYYPEHYPSLLLDVDVVDPPTLTQLEIYDESELESSLNPQVVAGGFEEMAMVDFDDEFSLANAFCSSSSSLASVIHCSKPLQVDTQINSGGGSSIIKAAAVAVAGDKTTAQLI